MFTLSFPFPANLFPTQGLVYVCALMFPTQGLMMVVQQNTMTLKMLLRKSNNRLLDSIQ